MIIEEVVSVVTAPITVTNKVMEKLDEELS